MSTVITHKQFANEHTWSMDLCGRPLTINMGKVAELATASALVTYGETTVLVATTVSPRPRDGIDFFPLSVDFEEKLYAVGRIPGSFMRREGQPSLPAVLAGRVIDRSIRPLFPYDFRNDVVCTCTVMSVDRDCSPEVTAMIGVSACLAVSCIPWAGPIGCLEMGYVDGRLVYNPTQEQKHASQLDLTVAATAGKVIMIEAGAKELPDAIMYDAIEMYLKNDGLSHAIIKEALDITQDARYAILDEIMLPCISAPRAEVSRYAPKMITVKIDPDKIREVIGKGGSVIQKITAESGAQIDIEDDGTIHIASPNAEACEIAKKMIDTIVFVPEVGSLYYGKVVRILQFGAFVELAPGKDGMVHISKLANHRVAKVEDVINIGDMIWVKVTDIDEKGRVNLSYKDALREIEEKKARGEIVK